MSRTNSAKFMGRALIALLLVLPATVFPEPIIVTGRIGPAFLGKPIRNLRLVNHDRNPIPFQIDQVLPDDDYVCLSGKDPNIGSGKLDSADEIVFLWEDAAVSEGPADSSSVKHGQRITIGHAAQKRSVYLVDDSLAALSPVRYITYDEQKETFSTPCYNGAFGKNRFHFIRAGVKDFARDSMVRLTNELRVKIYLRALWGLLPITYSENNIVCEVKRFKVGPIRLIRRGDFHLNLGLWMKGSHAAVNQLCYPDMVKAPYTFMCPFGSTRFSAGRISR